MGIKDNVKQVAADFLLGRAVRKTVETAQEEDDGLELNDDPLRRLLEGGESTDGSPVVTLSMADLVRRVLYDSGAEDPEGVIKKMGWDAPSPEVAEMESQASEKRVARVEGLSALVHALAQAALLPPAKAQGWPAHAYVSESEFSAHSSLAIIAQLVDLGLLEVSAPLGGVTVYKDGEDA